MSVDNKELIIPEDISKYFWTELTESILSEISKTSTDILSNPLKILRIEQEELIEIYWWEWYNLLLLREWISKINFKPSHFELIKSDNSF